MGEIEEINWSGETVAVHPREKLKKVMFPHKVSLVIPKADNDKFILCRRAKDKHPFPDTWCCAIGGKVDFGETYESAAVREMKEEADLESDLQKVVSFKYDEDDYKAIFTVFTTKNAVDMNTFTADPREIQYFKSFSLEEVESEVSRNSEMFAPTFRAAIRAFIEGLR